VVAPQLRPQAPQLFASVCSLTHPTPAQHDSPAGQAGPPLHDTGGIHMFPTHVSPDGQTWPQLPQLLGSVVVSVQPLVQHICPGAHVTPPLQPVMVQLLSKHVAPGGQARPQPPQLSMSLVVSVHPALQHVWVPVHAGPPSHEVVGWHMLCAQRLPVGQTLPQKPQSCALLVVSTQMSPQHESFAGHPVDAHVRAVHVPLMHDSPCPQTLPHVPQSFAFVSRFASQPSAKTPLQSAKPGEHALMAQWLAAHVELPFETAPQTPPQLPQWFGSLAVFAHMAPQHDSPVGQAPFAPHAPTHTPPEHDSPVPHARPQPPQFCASLPVFVSHPSAKT
jgi:hypothetical protein